MSRELLYEHAINTVLRAGEILRPQFGIAEIVDEKSQLATDVVTSLDREVETLIAEELLRFDQDIGFRGEEFGVSKSGELYWLVDPIDGTGHFVRGNDMAVTQLCLIENDRVIFSVINNFIKNDLYIAKLGHGSTRNGQPITVSQRHLRQSYVIVEMALTQPQTIEKYVNLSQKTLVNKLMAGGHEMAMVASGKYDARIAFHPFWNVWDYAPGSLLISEAGGRVANVGSATFDIHNHNLIATNPIIFGELTAGPDALFPIID